MIDITHPIFKYGLVAVALLTLLLSQIVRWKRFPILNLLNKWLRWFWFAGIFTYLLRLLDLSARPDWVHFVIGFMLWFLIETGYNWFAIKVLSSSDIPLFPKFKLDKDHSDYASSNYPKDWLEKKRFKRLSVLKAELMEDLFLRTFIYESADQKTRIQILLTPKRKDGANALYTIYSSAKNGYRLITNNHSLPFGGYYPEDWKVMRKPLIGLLGQLLQLHEKRLANTNAELVPFDGDPLDEINHQQKFLERFNEEQGFLNSLQYRDENGSLSYEGRYRLWKEMWLLAYLGVTVSK